MDVRPLLLTFVFAAALLPTAEADPLPVLAILDPIVVPDPSGDVRGEPVDAGAPAYMDLVEVQLDLDEEELRFEVTVADASGLAVAPRENVARPVMAQLAAMGERFLVIVSITDEVDVDGITTIGDRWGLLYRLQDDVWVRQAGHAQEQDIAAGTFRIAFPLEAIRDDQGFPLAPGAVVTLLSVVAREQIGGFFDPNDDPNAGTGAVTPRYIDEVDVPPDAFIAVPEQLQGLLQVVTELPLRYSNGGGSFRWPVQVHNPLDEAVAAGITVAAPDDVRTRAPSTLLLGAGETRVIDVFAVLPFGHQHGGTMEMRVSFDVGGDATVLPLGVHFLDIPQPAGHHDSLWLHGTADGAIDAGLSALRDKYMNTLADDPDDTATSMRPMSGGCGGNRGEYWQFPLEPQLLIGLDARTDETATFTATIGQGSVPQTGGDLHAKLILWPDPTGFGWENLSTDPDAAHMPIDVPVGGTQDIEMQVPIPGYLDRVEPRVDMPNLQFVVVYCRVVDSNPPLFVSGGTQVHHVILPGASLTLPLNEYQEQVDVAPEGQASLVARDTLLRAAPGATVLWEVAVDPAGGTYLPSIFGPADEHATLHHDAPISAPTTIPVSMLIPDVDDGSLLQVILILENADDPADASSIVLGVVVDPDSDRDDAARVAALAAGADKDASAPWLTAVVALALVGLARFRNRD